MASKLLSGLLAAALVAAPTGAFAQSAPAPATETVSGSGAIFGEGNTDLYVGITFALFVLVIAIWHGGSGDNDDDGGEPVTP